MHSLQGNLKKNAIPYISSAEEEGEWLKNTIHPSETGIWSNILYINQKIQKIMGFIICFCPWILQRVRKEAFMLTLQ